MESNSQTLKSLVTFHKVSEEEADIHHPIFAQLIILYINIFAEPPYNECFSQETVEEEFCHYIKNGILFYALADDHVIGFLGVTRGMENCRKDIKKELSNVGVFSDTDLYLADLAVAKKFRRQKIGSSLMDKMMTQYPHENMYLRTSAVRGNEKVIAFYQKLGFNIIEKRERVENTRTNGSIDYDERLYMYKTQNHYDSDRHSGDGYKSGAEHLY